MYGLGQKGLMVDAFHLTDRGEENGWHAGEELLEMLFRAGEGGGLPCFTSHQQQNLNH